MFFNSTSLTRSKTASVTLQAHAALRTTVLCRQRQINLEEAKFISNAVE